MSRILGLDLGANSLGWSVIDTAEKRILGSGVRIFPAGLNDFDTNKEQPKNAARRMARAVRRQIYRRKMRKQHLLKLLIEFGMVPLSIEELQAWKMDGDYPVSMEFRDWLSLQPYHLRARALEEPLSMYELGRIFYHMCQRRGFLSNRKSRGEEDGKIFEGNAAEGKVGIKETRDKLSEYRTLGAYLASLDPHKERIRNRYTERKMYVDEFEAVWEAQSYWNTNLTHEMRERIGGRSKDELYKTDGVLFFQRPLRSQRKTIGKCTFEPTKPRYLKDTLLYEEFRVTQTANHLEINGERLSEDDRQRVIAYMMTKAKPKFKDIRKLLKMTGPGYQSRWQDEDILPGARVTASLSEVFGPRWKTFTEKQKEDIWHLLLFAEDEHWLREYAANKWELDEDAIKKLLRIQIGSERGSLSRKALNGILYFLRLGFLYNQAVLLAGLRNAMGDEAWDAYEDKDTLIDTVLSFTHKSGAGTIKDQLYAFCLEYLRLDEKQLGKLYHHSLKDHIEIEEVLGEPPLIRNPLVMTAMYELRRVVNELIKEFGPFDAIKIELARDLKKTSAERSKIKSEIAQREREHLAIDAELRNMNIWVTHENRLKLKLYRELKQKCCPYTGKPIRLGQGSGLDLFSGRVQIEHIVPWQRSLNGSFFNLTLCDADLNREKCKLTPYEFFSRQGEDAWNFAKARAKDILPYEKFRAFSKKELDDDFVSRQLNDTRYASHLAKEYLRQICETVYVFPGGATAEMRHQWGLNSLLSEDDSKVRTDHRHHAVDAIAVAALGVNHLQQLARWNRYNKTYEMTSVEDPWEGFRDQTRDSIDRILVSYRKVDRVLTRRKSKQKRNGKWISSNGLGARGFLHKETIYGKRRIPTTGETRFVVRKLLDSIASSTHVEKIIDPAIRKLIEERLQELGVDTSAKKYNVPKGAFFRIDEEGKKQPLIYLKHRDGGQTPVRKVRMKENLGKAMPLKPNQAQWVNPRNNHHVAIYRDSKGKYTEDVVSFWEAVQRKMMGLKVFQTELEDGSRLVTTLQINDLFLLRLPSDALLETLDDMTIRKHLYRVQKISDGYYTFRLHTESTISRDEPGYFARILSFKAWEKYNPIKVRLSPTGKLSLDP